MLAFTNLITVLFDAYVMIALARVWLQFVRADFYSPLSQFVVRATQPFVAILRRFIPSMGAFDSASFVLAFSVMLLKFVFLIVLGSTSLPIVSIIVLVLFGLLKSAFWLLFIALIVNMILSFVSQGGNSTQYLLQQLIDPLLAPIRRFLPSLGGLDFSPLVLILAIQFLLDIIAQYLPYLL